MRPFQIRREGEELDWDISKNNENTLKASLANLAGVHALVVKQYQYAGPRRHATTVATSTGLARGCPDRPNAVSSACRMGHVEQPVLLVQLLVE